MRRVAPRAVGLALTALTNELAPATTLARIQGCWADAVGPTIAAEAEPLAEHDGTLTVACKSAVWAQELDLLAGDLLPRLNALVGASDGDEPVRELRVVAGGIARPSGRS